MARIALEICVDDTAGIAAAAQGGADRIELCAALALGGLTPSAGLIEIAAEGPLPAMAMIRPRAGDFVWSAADIRAQIAEIEAVRQAGLAGVVIGASRPDGTLDADALRALVDAAAGLDITLHRAIDLTPDPEAAMALCRELGIGRVLSSGGAQSAPTGIDRLARMAHAQPTISVMPGGGVTAQNVAAIAARMPLREVHASCAVPLLAPANPAITAFGFQPDGAKGTDAQRVATLRAALDQIASAAPGSGCTAS